MPTQNQYIDNYDARSHYSDSAAAVTTLYSVGAGGSSSVSGGGGGGAIESVHLPVGRALSNCGTLRSSYFKSNQSLCSCNAETEVRYATRTYNFAFSAV